MNQSSSFKFLYIFIIVFIFITLQLAIAEFQYKTSFFFDDLENNHCKLAHNHAKLNKESKIPPYCVIDEKFSFNKFIWFVSDGFSRIYGDQLFDFYNDHSSKFLINVPGYKFSHAIYSSWFTGQPPINYKGKPVVGDSIFKGMKDSERISSVRYVGPLWSFGKIASITCENPLYHLNHYSENSKSVPYEFFYNMNLSSFSDQCSDEPTICPNFQLTPDIEKIKSSKQLDLSDISLCSSNSPTFPRLCSLLESLANHGQSLITHSGAFDKLQHSMSSPLESEVQQYSEALEGQARVVTALQIILKEFINQNDDYILILSSDHGIDGKSEWSPTATLHEDGNPKNVGFFIFYNPRLFGEDEKTIDVVDVAPTVTQMLQGVQVPFHSKGVFQIESIPVQAQIQAKQRNLVQLLKNYYFTFGSHPPTPDGNVLKNDKLRSNSSFSYSDWNQELQFLNNLPHHYQSLLNTQEYNSHSLEKISDSIITLKRELFSPPSSFPWYLMSISVVSIGVWLYFLISRYIFSVQNFFVSVFLWLPPFIHILFSSFMYRDWLKEQLPTQWLFVYFLFSFILLSLLKPHSGLSPFVSIFMYNMFTFSFYSFCTFIGFQPHSSKFLLCCSALVSYFLISFFFHNSLIDSFMFFHPRFGWGKFSAHNLYGWIPLKILEPLNQYFVHGPFLLLIVFIILYEFTADLSLFIYGFHIVSLPIYLACFSIFGYFLFLRQFHNVWIPIFILLVLFYRFHPIFTVQVIFWRGFLPHYLKTLYLEQNNFYYNSLFSNLIAFQSFYMYFHVFNDSLLWNFDPSFGAIGLESWNVYPTLSGLMMVFSRFGVFLFPMLLSISVVKNYRNLSDLLYMCWVAHLISCLLGFCLLLGFYSVVHAFDQNIYLYTLLCVVVFLYSFFQLFKRPNSIKSLNKESLTF